MKSIIKMELASIKCNGICNEVKKFYKILLLLVKSIMKSAVKSVMKSAVKSINDIHSEICNEFNEIL